MAMRLRKTHGGSQMLRLRHSLNGFCSAHDHAAPSIRNARAIRENAAVLGGLLPQNTVVAFKKSVSPWVDR